MTHRQTQPQQPRGTDPRRPDGKGRQHTLNPETLMGKSVNFKRIRTVFHFYFISFKEPAESTRLLLFSHDALFFITDVSEVFQKSTYLTLCLQPAFGFLL